MYIRIQLCIKNKFLSIFKLFACNFIAFILEWILFAVEDNYCYFRVITQHVYKLSRKKRILYISQSLKEFGFCVFHWIRKKTYLCRHEGNYKSIVISYYITYVILLIFNAIKWFYCAKHIAILCNDAHANCSIFPAIPRSII